MQNSRPSDTARLVARSIILASLDDKLKVLVAAGEAEAIRDVLRKGYERDLLTPTLRFGLVRCLFQNFERMLLPGIIAHYLVRKRQIELAVETAIDKGCGRLVVVGAGYDTLAWRLHRLHPEVEFVELDHPATQRVKETALKTASNFTFRSIDLSFELPSTVLAEHGPASQKSAVFVIEGVTMYLPPEQVARLITDLSNMAGPSGRIIFTFMERDQDGTIAFRRANPLIDRWLKARSEPFLWGISRAGLIDFLNLSGADLIDLADHERLREQQLVPHGLERLPLAQGELICTATPLSR